MQSVYAALVAYLGLHFVILIHEVGHYLVGRYFNLAMPRLFIGIGPRLLRRQFGETEFAWRLIPIYGGVHILGILGPEHDSELARLYQTENERRKDAQVVLNRVQTTIDEAVARGEDTIPANLLDEMYALPKTSPMLDPKRHYNDRSGWVQLAVVLAGPAASIVLAFALWTLLAVSEYRTPTIFRSSGRIGAALPDSRLGKLGVVTGDVLVVESRRPGVDWWEPKANDSSHLYIVLLESKTIVHPDLHTRLSTQGVLAPLTPDGPRCRFALASFKNTNFLYRAAVVFDQCASPYQDPEVRFHDPFGFGILMANVRLGWSQGWFSIGGISFLIGLFNLLPIPPLDGGRAVFALLGVVGRPTSQRVILWLSVIGSYAVLGFLIYSVAKSWWGS